VWKFTFPKIVHHDSNMIYYDEMHRQTFEKLTWLKGRYYIKNPSIRFMFVTFQYYCICWMSKNPRFIMTCTRWWSRRIWLFYYILLFTKPKQHVIEIIYGRGKFVGDFNIWVHYKGLHQKPKHTIYVRYFSILLYLLNVQVAPTENKTS
jgi:hypothetical protein